MIKTLTVLSCYIRHSDAPIGLLTSIFQCTDNVLAQIA
jgi:hypothetical protein